MSTIEEGFYQYDGTGLHGTFSAEPPEARYSWHGDAPRLATADQDASYAQIQPQANGAYAALWVTKWTRSASSPLKVNIQVWQSIPSDGRTYSYYWNVAHLNGRSIYASDDPNDTTRVNGYIPWSPGGGWTTTVLTIPISSTEMRDALTSGDLVLMICSNNLFDVGSTFRCSQLHITTGTPPLRWRQRSDGLGAGPPRHRQRSTIQSSLRTRGIV